MIFPFQNCIVSTDNFSIPQARELLDYHHDMRYILLDLQRFQEEMRNFAEENILADNLSSLERVNLRKFTSNKRRREWLGGRFAAKYVAAGVLGQNADARPWTSLAVIPDKNGRPFLATDKNNGLLPDISISHSRDLAAAKAVNKGLCGIDIQKVTDQVVKVRERFCTSAEEHIIQSFFNAPPENHSSSLAKLWAAKEALRKVANMSSLPGFLELELTEILQGSSHKGTAPWKFIIIWKHIDMNGTAVAEKCSVAVSLIADYALALTTRNDTLD